MVNSTVISNIDCNFTVKLLLNTNKEGGINVLKFCARVPPKHRKTNLFLPSGQQNYSLSRIAMPISRTLEEGGVK